MTDDLDKLEAIARAAQGGLCEPWSVEPNPNFNLVIDASQRDLEEDEDARADNIVEDALDRPLIASHIATFSPNVVLRLFARVRELERLKQDHEGHRL
jgi:hypothetical protein